MPNLRLIQSLAAGIEHIVADKQLPRSVPVCRIVDTTLEEGMASYVSWAVIQHHRSMRTYNANASAGVWRQLPTVWPHNHRVGIAGLGVLGLACARALSSIGYPVSGWSLRPKAVHPGYVEGFHGDEQLGEFLSGCATLVCLLPLTEQTKGFLGRQVFSQLPRGAHVINVARGAHLVEADLLEALEAGQLSAATLDTFGEEPLPKMHPFWSDPRIVVTPHIAAHTDPRIIAKQTLQNLELILQGKEPGSRADLVRGY
jgi:glyoxylate/hydroxypyruvate reductase A